MQLSAKALTIVSAILWGASILLVGLVNLAISCMDSAPSIPDFTLHVRYSTCWSAPGMESSTARLAATCLPCSTTCLFHGQKRRNQKTRSAENCGRTALRASALPMPPEDLRLR